MKIFTCFLVALMATFPFPVRAHEGEEEKPAAPVQRASGQTTLFTQSEHFELVIKSKTMEPSKESKIKIFLSDYATNAPVPNAQIKIESAGGDISVDARTGKDPGIYTASLTFPKKGNYSLTFDITAKDKSDLLSIENVSVGMKEEKRPSAGKRFSGTLKKMAAGAALLGLAWSFLSRIRRKKRREAT